MRNLIQFFTVSVALALTGCLSVTNPQSADPHLVFHCTFDDVASVEHPAVGQPGEHTDLKFEEGVSGKALYVPVDKGVAKFPLPNGLPAAGTLEFDAKILAENDGFGHKGNPILFAIINPKTKEWGMSCYMWLEFNANNGVGGYGLSASVCGTLHAAQSGGRYSSVLGENWKEWHKYRIVWNQAGIGDDATKTSIVYVDGDEKVVFTDKDYTPDRIVNAFTTKRLDILFSTPIDGSVPGANRVPFLIDNFKIWDRVE